MHPMFVKLFLEGEADDLVDEEKKRRSAHRARRNRSRMVVRVAARDRDPQPRR